MKSERFIPVLIAALLAVFNLAAPPLAVTYCSDECRCETSIAP